MNHSLRPKYLHRATICSSGRCGPPESRPHLITRSLHFWIFLFVPSRKAHAVDFVFKSFSGCIPLISTLLLLSSFFKVNGVSCPSCPAIPEAFLFRFANPTTTKSCILPRHVPQRRCPLCAPRFLELQCLRGSLRSGQPDLQGSDDLVGPHSAPSLHLAELRARRSQARYHRSCALLVFFGQGKRRHMGCDLRKGTQWLIAGTIAR